MSLAWTTIEDAITAWVIAGSGIAAGSVIWGEQNGGRIATPYIDLVTEIEDIGPDWIFTDDAAAPSAENEIDYFSQGMRRMTIRMRCFGGPAKGSTSAKARLEAVKASHRLPSNHEALRIADIGISEFSPVSNITGVLNSTKLEPRAMMDVIAFVPSSISETGTYIEVVSIENQSTGVEFEVDLTVSAVRWTELGTVRVTETGAERFTE